MSKRNVVVGISWPYSNSNLHIGYIASSLSGDILARYHRMKGDDVVMVSGTDSHGTKMEIRAKAEGCSPKDIADRYDQNFREALKAFSFSFDKYSITYDKFHKEKCKEFFIKLFENGYIVPRTEKRTFCTTCNKFVADTEIKIVCPVCGKETKADNCDCGYVPVEKDLEGATCLICGHKTELRENSILVFRLSAFKKQLKKLLDDNKDIWRANSVNETKKYLDKLIDRDFSRDLAWGVEVPIAGYEDKKVWVWYEALLGYITDTMELGEEQGFDWQRFWKTNVEPDREKIVYMCHAKDNIMFHSIMLPAMLMGLKDNFYTNIHMVSAEYLTMNDVKISKSQGNGFEALEMSKRFDTDSLRFHFALNGPEKKDANFTLDTYAVTHNSDVVNKFANLINRTLKFKGLETLPEGIVDENVYNRVKDIYNIVGDCIEKTEIKKATSEILDLIMETNRFFDDQKPWAQFKEDDKTSFNNTIFTCAFVLANLTNLLEPIMPKTTEKLRNFLQIDSKPTWELICVKPNISLDKVEPLFSRI
ncbi:MAG: methionine--tRNA ligase [Clostridia bacterium]